LRRPKHLPASTARDVITRVHFFQVKEQIVKAGRNGDLPEPYSVLKVFTNLSAQTFQFQKSLVQITTMLRAHNVPYRWGFPAKLIVHHHNSNHPIASVEEGVRKLTEWGLPRPDVQLDPTAKIPRLS
ncbi:Hypothetical predicted protein, partial [Pelobates cultripes]